MPQLGPHAEAHYGGGSVSTGNRQGEPDEGSLRIDAEQLHHISEVTIAHYERLAKGSRRQPELCGAAGRN